MSNGPTKISGLPVATSLNPVDLFAIVQSGTTKQWSNAVGGGLAFVVTNVAALKALTPPTAAMFVATEGYYTAGDGGAATYWWNSTDTTADNGGTVIASNAGGTGRWNLLPELIISCEQFGMVGDNKTDNASSFQDALTYIVQNNTKLFLGQGVFLVKSGVSATAVLASNYGKNISIEGVGPALDGSVPATIIKWGGTTNSANTLFEADGLESFKASGISFYGSNGVGKVFYATQSATTYGPFGWGFEDCTFEQATSAGYGFYIDTSTNMARFNFTRCKFEAGPGASGFYTANQDSVNHVFVSCAFNLNQYGINLDGGSFKAVGCEFTQQSSADINLTANVVCDLVGCWSEQSNQFIVGDVRDVTAGINLMGCICSSYPWSYWKLDESGRTQPTNDYTQWIAIKWDGNRPMNMIGCRFIDPFNGASTGSTPPLTSSSNGITVAAPNFTGVPSYNITGSFSQIGVNSFVENQFLDLGTNNFGAPRSSVRQRYVAQTIGSASATLYPCYASWMEVTMTASTTYTIDTTHSAACDRFRLSLIQGGAGSFAPTFVNTKIVGGSFTPTTTVGALSYIEFEFNGTSWEEVGRGLNLS